MQASMDLINLQNIAKKNFYETLEDAVGGAVTVDCDGKVVWINDSYIDFLGYDNKKDVIGKNVVDVVPGTMLPHVINTGKPILLDLLEYKNGWTVVSRYPLKDKEGTVIGAFGFLLFDNVEGIEPILKKIKILRSDLEQAKIKLKSERQAKYSLNNIVGVTDSIVSVKKQARQASNSVASMIIFGETGTGKELIAQAIHSLSKRSSKKFVAINVAAIPENLVEVEFFGAVAGAYTGVNKSGRVGKMELANGGTLFLDEIGDMPMNVQSKLLRALEEREVEPVGSNKIIPIDIRVIAATSLDLEKLVSDGKFRADLYYRLNVIPINIPPLRDRVEDIELLCEAILEKVSIQEGCSPKFIDTSAVEALKRHDWPGNVRELKNVLERACAMSSKSTISVDDINSIVDISRVDVDNNRDSFSVKNVSLKSLISEYEKKLIIDALNVCGNNKSSAADMLKMPRSSFYAKLKEYGI